MLTQDDTAFRMAALSPGLIPVFRGKFCDSLLSL